MKKFFAFVAAALVAFSFTACNGNSAESKAFKIEVSNISGTKASVAVTPVDAEAAYYWNVVEAEALVGLNNDSIYLSIKENMDAYIEMYAYYGYDLTYADFLDKGASNYDFTGLNPETDYVVIAFKADEATGMGFGGVARKEFKTGVVEQSNLTFDVQVGESSIAISPSNEEDSWDYYLLTAEDFATEWNSDKDELAAAYFDYYGDYYAGPGEYELGFQDIVDAFEQAGDYVLLLWGVDGVINTEIFKFEFNIPDTFVPASGEEGGEELAAPKKLGAKKLANELKAVRTIKKVIR